MFRLLAILIALQIVLEGDGAPGVAKSGESIDIKSFEERLNRNASGKYGEYEHEIASSQKVLDKAKSMVNRIRFLLQRGYDPYEDTGVAEYIKDAVIKYNEATEHEWTALDELQDADHKTKTDTILKELSRISEEIDNGNNSLPEAVSGEIKKLSELKPTAPGVNEFSSATIRQDRATRWINALQASVLKKGADAEKDEGLLRLLGSAIDKYNTAHDREWAGSRRLDDEPLETRAKVLLDELASISKDAETRNHGDIRPLENPLAVAREMIAAATPKTPSPASKKGDLSTKRGSQSRNLLSQTSILV